MSEIHKLGKKRRQEPIKQPKIVGAKPLDPQRAPQVIDQRTKTIPTEIPTKTHGEVVTVKEHTRSKPSKPDEPDVRLRTMTPEEKQEWQDVKSGKWEPA